MIRNRQRRTKPVDVDVPYQIHLVENTQIQQIKNYQELCQEALDMHHCVEIYHNEIASGRYAVFRVLTPERMTVGISIKPKLSFPYQIEQISGVRNARPNEETLTHVHQWLAQQK
ncbi:MAG: PcfJ domain-containing protein, partial [Vibrio sp.]